MRLRVHRHLSYYAATLAHLSQRHWLLILLEQELPRPTLNHGPVLVYPFLLMHHASGSYTATHKVGRKISSAWQKPSSAKELKVP
jgi:hypothetical protein